MSDFNIDFVGVGPQRTGSTWLDRVLRAHPVLCLPENVKETKFFDQHFSKGLDWYAWHYRHCAPSELRGEMAPTYFDVPDARRRLHAHNPECKVIVGLRDPAARAFSLYQHHRREGRVPEGFRAAVRQIPRIVEAGRYAQHVPGWIEAFGREQVLFVLLDDVKRRPAWVLRRVCDFLGVEPMEPPEAAAERVNATTRPHFAWVARAAVFLAKKLRGRRLHRLVEWGKKIGLKSIYTGGVDEQSEMAPANRRHLVEAYEADIRYAEQMLERELSGWRAVPDTPPAETA
jgi:hypothetical protein